MIVLFVHVATVTGSGTWVSPIATLRSWASQGDGVAPVPSFDTSPDRNDTAATGFGHAGSVYGLAREVLGQKCQ